MGSVINFDQYVSAASTTQPMLRPVHNLDHSGNRSAAYATAAAAIAVAAAASAALFDTVATVHQLLTHYIEFSTNRCFQKTHY